MISRSDEKRKSCAVIFEARESGQLSVHVVESSVSGSVYVNVRTLLSGIVTILQRRTDQYLGLDSVRLFPRNFVPSDSPLDEICAARCSCRFA